MAGLGNPNAGGPAPGVAPAAAPAAPGGEAFTPARELMGDPDESELEDASPEEQAQFEVFERKMLGVIYPEASPGEVNPAVIDNLRGQFDPSALEMFEQAQPPLTDSALDSAAATAVLIAIMIEQTSDEQFSDDVALHGGMSVIEELIEVGEAAKIHDFSERDIETVTYRAMDLYRIASPRVDPASLSEEFKQMMAANEAGNLTSILPGLPGGPALNKEA